MSQELKTSPLHHHQHTHAHRTAHLQSDHGGQGLVTDGGPSFLYRLLLPKPGFFFYDLGMQVTCLKSLMVGG